MILNGYVKSLQLTFKVMGHHGVMQWYKAVLQMLGWYKIFIKKSKCQGQASCSVT